MGGDALVLRGYRKVATTLHTLSGLMASRIGSAATEEGVQLSGPLTTSDLCANALAYIRSLRVYGPDGNVHGVKFAAEASEQSLYGLAALIMTSSLLGLPREDVHEELQLLKHHQRQDGVFVDKSVDTTMGWREDWWGVRHLTLHCVAALGVYGVECPFPADAYPIFRSESDWLEFIRSANWGSRVAYTSNTLQNYGAVLQYARDFQGSSRAAILMEILLAELDKRVRSDIGMWGDIDFSSPHMRSEGVQAAYHFWLLYFYEGRTPPWIEAAVPTLIATQNPRGGFGVRWNSSCCESIDSIDPLSRISRIMPQYRADVLPVLERSVPDAMSTLNPDGGFTFRRGDKLSYGDSSSTYQGRDKSSSFFTWFRLLSIALATQAIGRGISHDPPMWNWVRVPGHQF